MQVLRNDSRRTIASFRQHELTGLGERCSMLPQIGFLAKLRLSSMHGLFAEGTDHVAHVSIQTRPSSFEIHRKTHQTFDMLWPGACTI